MQELVRINALSGDTLCLTPLGVHLASLPCSPRVGKILIFGALFGCLGPASAIAACLVSKSPFINASDGEMKIKIKNSMKQ
jgi:HrpA-like RNA helicase